MTAALNIGRSLSLPLDAVTRAWGIVGQRGTGKTSTAVVVVEEAVKAGAQVAVIDPTGAWYGLRSSASGKAAGLPVVVFGGHNGDLPLEHTAGAFLARLVIEQHLNVVLDLERMTKGQQVQFVAEFAETLYHENRTALTLVVDEAHRFAPQQLREPGGYGARCLGAVTDVVTLGRRKGLGAILISQRPAKISKDTFEQSEIMIVHRLLGPNDRKAIAGWLDEVAEGKDEPLLSHGVPRLERGEAVVYAPTYDVAEMVAIRPKRTFDSSATPEVGAAAVVPKGRADVDLEVIRAAMAETIERIEQDDPKKLRARIVQLERERATDASADDLFEARERVELLSTALSEAEAEQARREAALVERVDAWRERFAPLFEEMMAATLSLTGDPPASKPRPIRLVREATAEPRVTGNTAAGLAIGERHAAAMAREAERVDPASPARGRVAIEMGLGGNGGGGEVKLKAGARRMVEVMARMHPMKLNRAQVAALAGMKRTSGTFSQYVGAILRGGYAVESSEGWELTEAGFALVGGKPKAPQTTEETREMWRGKMKAGARRMLDILIERRESMSGAYGDPGWMTRIELASAAGITPSSGTFSQYLGTLRRAGLLDESDGDVRASDVLFLTNGRR